MLQLRKLAPALVAAGCVIALATWAYMGVAFADEEEALKQLEKSEAAVGSDDSQSSEQSSTQDAKSDGSAESDEEGEGEGPQPSSEVVTSYYHDAWYEAGHSDGTVSRDTNDDAAGESEAASDSGTKDNEDSQDPDAAGEEAGEQELDPLLNDVGEDNYIDLQQIPDTSFLYDTTIYDLVNLGASGGRTQPVVVKGEVVGEPIRAEHGKYWITLDHVDDDDEAESGKKEASISVLIDESSLKLIDTFGGYNKRGTILRVRGTFYYACTSHEGIMDIHAESVSVSEHGQTTADTFDRNAFIPGAILCGIALVLTIIYQVLAERQR